jgi:hypothetical protein
MQRLQLASLASTLLLGLVACGGDGKATPDSSGGGDDASPPADARIDAPPAPPMITVTGTAFSRGTGPSTPVADAVIQLFRDTDESTPIGMTTTNAQGAFSITVSTGGVAVEGFLKATKATFKDTYLYPPGPIAADTTAPVNMIAANLWDTLSNVAQGDQMNGNGLIALVVVDGSAATSMAVAGATVSSNPAATAVRYSGALGLPSPQPTATAADGLAYLFNVRPNVPITVSATKPGSTFKTHGLKAWPDNLTTTLITP